MATKFITLKMLNSTERPDRNDRRNVVDLHYHDDETDDTGEDDGMADALASTALTTTVVPWKPLTINVDTIRNFYPRKGGAQGCRLLLKQGVAYIVADEHADILALING